MVAVEFNIKAVHLGTTLKSGGSVTTFVAFRYW